VLVRFGGAVVQFGPPRALALEEVAMQVAEVRARLDHPVIDADGHTIEFVPALVPYLREEGVTGDLWRLFGDSLGPDSGLWTRLAPDERCRRRTARPPWWAVPTRNTRDFATATLPGLLHERLPELGIDFAVVYPSLGLVFPHLDDDDQRVGACRALNRYHADVFGPYRDRVEPVAAVPMHTPQEAIGVLDHAVLEVGLKAVMIAGYVRRPIPAASGDPDAGRFATWLDFFGVDSQHDYDPVWARCVELGVSVGAHSFAMGWDARRSVSNYMCNHLGHFAAAGDALCRALFMGGVTRRFPALRVAFLEGGVSWARTLYCDLVGHWEKRNPAALENYDPARFDRDLFGELLGRYGKDFAELTADAPGGLGTGGPDGSPHDDFGACDIGRAEDIYERFVPGFFFGCEADDPTTTTAFDEHVNPFGARLNAMFSSDIGHWDVPDMADVLPESYEAVEHGWLSDDDFRDFVFANPARFYTDSNPGFFDGTTVEEPVRALLGRVDAGR